MKHTKEEKQSHLEQILRTTDRTANNIQQEMKGTEWSMRRTVILQASKQVRETELIRHIKSDDTMLLPTKEKLIGVIHKNFKAGKHIKNLDMMNTIYKPETVEARMRRGGSP